MNLKLIPMLMCLGGMTIIAIGLYSYLLDIGPNHCEMTYMFEYPIFTKLRLPNSVKNLYPQYDLYAYSEGAYTKRVQKNIFIGIPVLFLPGNAGSYQQVRSLASVSLRKSEDIHNKVWFDYFSTDFNEELSGLVGSLLEKQTQFSIKVIKHILSYYKKSRKIVLVGHSMGGIVARAILSRGLDDVIDLVYTQATPHLAPPMIVDSAMINFYQTIETLEAKKAIHTSPIVSVSGGRRDIIVPNHLSSLDGLDVARGSLAVSTTSIPRVWASTDHLCVIWCKQLVLVTVRSMFDLTMDGKTLVDENSKRAEILYNHFLSKSLTKTDVNLPNNIKSEPITLPNWKWKASKTKSKPKFFHAY